MKVFIKVVSPVIIIFLAVAGPAAGETQPESFKGTITLSGAWALYPMVVRWAEEFRKLHPDVTIDVAAGGAGKGMVDCLSRTVDIGMVSREIYPAEIEKGAWWVSVTKDAVVPTVNAANPVIKKILSRGVGKDTFDGIWITGKIKSWGEVVNDPLPAAIHVYTRSDACGAAETWARYLGKNQEDLRDVGVFGDPGLAEAVRKDVLGIGFNNIGYAYDAATGQQIEGLRVVPIDLSGNGSLDPEEDFYGTRDELTGAIADGKYPSPPARNLHFVSQGRPDRPVVREFIRWVLTAGQKYVPESGYINLGKEKLQEELGKLER
ncbi:MAG: substrate-binding domain-containing protein [PVC group bacterium]